MVKYNCGNSSNEAKDLVAFLPFFCNCDYDLDVYKTIPIGQFIVHDDFQIIGNVFDLPELIKSGTINET